jgi:predicted ATPase
MQRGQVSGRGFFAPPPCREPGIALSLLSVLTFKAGASRPLNNSKMMNKEVTFNGVAIDGGMDGSSFRSTTMHRDTSYDSLRLSDGKTKEPLHENATESVDMCLTRVASDPQNGETKATSQKEEDGRTGEQQEDDLNWSGKLYGRLHQKQQLFQAYKRRRDHGNRRAELSIITGPSGTGKSFLARILEEQVCQQDGGLFLNGKCDQINHASEPCAPFVAALTQFVERWTEKDLETRQFIRQQAKRAIPELTEVKLLTDMVPSMSKLFCNKNREMDISTHLASNKSHPEAENPSITVVCKFLRALSSSNRPIVLFIDDFQWIDSSSLKLFEALARETGMLGFMLLGTCRGNEVSVDNPIAKSLRELEETHHVVITDIALDNLTEDAVHELVMDAFKTLSGEDLSTLSSSIFVHTKGNAFFALQMLRTLKDSGVLSSLDGDSPVDKLVSLDCDALVDMSVHDAAKGSPVAEAVIKVASCLGAHFAAHHVQIAVKANRDEITEALAMLQQRHLVRAHRGGQVYSWTHDKFQAAGYQLLQDGEREMLHLSIGRRLLNSLEVDDLQQHVFVVASHFCISLGLVEEDEKEAVATILLRAGEKSATSSAFAAASSYFAMGIHLLREDHWMSQYRLSLRLYNAASEMECCLGHSQQTDKLVDEILQRARTFADRLRAYETKIYSLGSRQEMPQAIDLALVVFKKLGEKFPRTPSLLTIAYEMFSTKHMLSKKTEDDILGLSPLRDWRKAAVLRIMQLVFPSVMRGCPKLAPVLACRCIKITLKHGLCGMSCAAFGAFGLVLTHPLGFVEEGNKYARIGMKILEKYSADEMKCRLTLVLHGFCLPYKTPLRDTLEPLKAAAPLGFLTGDLEIACLSLHCRAITGAFCGIPVESTHSEMLRYIGTFREMGQDLLVSHLSVFAQMMENLRYPKRDPCLLTGNALNEGKTIERVKLARDESESINIWLSKAFLALYLGEHRRGKGFMRALRKHSIDGVNAAMVYQVFFLDAMMDLVIARKSGSRTKRYKSPLKKLRLHAKHAPENVMNKICLIEAERAALKNDRVGALSKFKQSMDLACEQGLINEQALACERTAVALLEWGDSGRALEVFEEARRLYEQWGSPVKVEQLSNFVLQEFQ